MWERSSVWLERMPVTHEVASSSLVVPELKSGRFFLPLFNSVNVLWRELHFEFGGFADGWSEHSEQIRIASELSLLWQSHIGETSRAWSKSKTASSFPP